MKKYLTAIIIVVGLLGGFYYFFDMSGQTLAKSKNAFEAAQTQVNDFKAQREASSNQIVALNKSVRDSVGFLQQWKAYYAANRDYETLINKLAEKAACAVVGRKWETKKVIMGKLSYDTDCFTGTVVGDYRDIVKFIGQLESQLQLSTIWNLEFKPGVNEITCSITVYFPNFVFEGGGPSL